MLKLAQTHAKVAKNGTTTTGAGSVLLLLLQVTDQWSPQCEVGSRGGL